MLAHLFMVCACQAAHMVTRGQFSAVVSSLVLPCEFWASHSGSQVWWQAPGPTGSLLPRHSFPFVDLAIQAYTKELSL